MPSINNHSNNHSRYQELYQNLIGAYEGLGCQIWELPPKGYSHLEDIVREYLPATELKEKKYYVAVNVKTSENGFKSAFADLTIEYQGRQIAILGFSVFGNMISLYQGRSEKILGEETFNIEHFIQLLEVESLLSAQHGDHVYND